jgi:hypothetical protein
MSATGAKKQKLCLTVRYFLVSQDGFLLLFIEHSACKSDASSPRQSCSAFTAHCATAACCRHTSSDSAGNTDQSFVANTGLRNDSGSSASLDGYSRRKALAAWLLDCRKIIRPMHCKTIVVITKR